MKPTDEQWSLISKNFLDKTIARDEIEVFPAIAATTEYNESHKMKLSEEVVRQLANQYNDGRAITLFHNNEFIPAGKTFKAYYDPSHKQAKVWAYARKGIDLGHNISTDNIMKQIDAGIQSDVSIEFSADTYKCSICGNDVRDFGACDHIPGEYYDDQLCFIQIAGKADASTLSLVTAGSLPSARIVPTEKDLLVEKGLSKTGMIMFDKSYDSNKKFVDINKFNKKKEERFMSKEQEQEKPNATKDDKLIETIQNLTNVVSEMKDEFKSLKPEQDSPADDKDTPTEEEVKMEKKTQDREVLEKIISELAVKAFNEKKTDFLEKMSALELYKYREECLDKISKDYKNAKQVEDEPKREFEIPELAYSFKKEDK